MPESMSAITDLIARCEEKAIPTTLLVVPGREWSAGQITLLKHWQANGHELAAHGWLHEARAIRKPWHRIHSTLVSRNVAEHLDLEPEEQVPFIARSIRWFAEQELSLPSIYVPPAWALGRLTREQRDRLLQAERMPAQLSIETTSGFIHLPENRRQWMPLTGYEADTPARALFLRCFNALNLAHARFHSTCLRISVHPYDMQYRLASSLRTHLEMPVNFSTYSKALYS
jgi:hypothetical protein